MDELVNGQAMMSLADDQAKLCLSKALPSVRPAPKQLSWSPQQTLSVELQRFRWRGSARRGRCAFMQPGLFVP